MAKIGSQVGLLVPEDTKARIVLYIPILHSGVHVAPHVTYFRMRGRLLRHFRFQLGCTDQERPLDFSF